MADKKLKRFSPSKMNTVRTNIDTYLKKRRADTKPSSQVYTPIDTTGSPYPKAPDLTVKGDSGKITPAQNRVTPAVNDSMIPSHLKSSAVTSQEPSFQYPLRVTAAKDGGLQVKDPSDDKPVVTGNLSTKSIDTSERIDMHEQARNMIQRPTSTEELLKRKK